MTNAEIIEAAAKLGIKPTRAPVNSAVWQCWADRVHEAYARSKRFDWACEKGIHPNTRAAIAEANRYAV